ncbi:hypothetical protein FOYG_00081 [Fusarium oxysporum NRRL 32931]|uniref:Uncharacterized protein n=1 Tax=Fusarium oxysporum NRRL 32931 TaxID=660029 RepID=W9J5V3_FUSOX|nr:hypothetical protein FOYG_00081 [Fusarium oxysporum NRRL 32931]
MSKASRSRIFWKFVVAVDYWQSVDDGDGRL